MIKNKVLLIQKENSPLEALVEQSLTKNLGAAVSRAQLPHLPEQDTGESLVIWDTSGFSDDEVRIITPELADRGSMVLVACSQVDDLTCSIVEDANRAENAGKRAPQVVGLVPAPGDASQLAALIQPPLEYAARIKALEAEVERLTEEVENRRIIERAKYSLMFARGLGEDQAYHSMRQYCRSHNMRMVDVAKRILKAYSLFDGS